VRAALLHAPGDLRVEELPDPVAGPGEVVLGVRAALSCGTDVKTFRRGHPSIRSWPSRLGHEFAGVVEQAGPGVEAVREGDLVLCGNSAPCGTCHQCARGRESLCEDLLLLLGGFGERVLVPERVVARNLHPLPAGLDLRLAPLAEPLACAVHALEAAGPAPGDPVAILGAGSLGAMLCALVADAGGRPIVLDPHEERLEAVRAFGAAETVRATRGPGDVARVRALTEGRGAELVVEAVGRPEAWELAVAMAAPGGAVDLFGGCPAGTAFSVPTARVHYEQVRLVGTFHHAPRYLARALRVLAGGRHPWERLLGPVIALDDLPRALAGGLGPPVAPKYTLLPEGARP
jgi:L-iditol 2-dehydrogenase